MARLPAGRLANGCCDEKLKLPAVATWWCGERPALDYVLAHLDQLVIKPAYPNQRFEPVFGRDLTKRGARGAHRAAARAALRVRRAGARGVVAGAGVATERRPGAVSEGACDSRVRHCYGRTASASCRAGSRASRRTRRWTWCRLSAAAAARISGCCRTTRRQMSRLRRRQRCRPCSFGRIDIPSRVVENLFWLGRYAVRCEDKARLIRSTLAARVDAMGVAHGDCGSVAISASYRRTWTRRRVCATSAIRKDSSRM